MNIFQYIRKAVNYLFGRTNVENAFGITIPISPRMENAMTLWEEMYEDRPGWKNYEKGQLTLNIPAAISSEIARLVTIEMRTKVTGSPRAEYLNKQYQNVVRKARNFTEKATAKGGIVLKPFVVDGDIKVTVVESTDFFPCAFDSDDNVTAGVFMDYSYIEDKRYTRLEYHSLEGKRYTITNKVYCNRMSEISGSLDDSLGKEVPLAEVPEWAEISPVVTINDVERVLFSYFKMPYANNIEAKSPLGVSCFSRAVEQIKKADEIWSEISWEFKAKELAIHASSNLFKRNQDGTPILPEGVERIFRTFEFDRDEKLDTYDPAFRDVSLFNGLNKTLHKIEFLCGLAYGTISEPTETDKTATEVKQSRQRSFSTVSDTQKSLQDALEHLLYAMDVLTTLYNLAPAGEYTTSFEWDDSIIVDREVEFARLMSMAAAGMIREEIVVAWYFGVSEEEAKKMMPSHVDVLDKMMTRTGEE